MDGPVRAQLELVMYGDFQCPYCAAAFPIVKRVREELADRLLFAFRHFPLHAAHPLAQDAAEASEAAAAQGAFWPMHDRLYEAGGRLERPDLVRYAGELGIDGDRVRSELEDGRHAQRVERDAHSAQASGVAGTPGLFANGFRHDEDFDAGSLIEAQQSTAERQTRLG
jgi:protein-disulfide isomerase